MNTPLNNDMHIDTIIPSDQIDLGDVLLPGNPRITDAKTPEELKEAMKYTSRFALFMKRAIPKGPGMFDAMVKEILDF